MSRASIIIPSAIALAFASSIAWFALAADPEPAKTPAKFDWTPCDKEIKEFGCKGTDKEIWQCLEKADAQDKLSKTCDAQHEKGDALFGK
jgi:hypothetical protein